MKRFYDENYENIKLFEQLISAHWDFFRFKTFWILQVKITFISSSCAGLINAVRLNR